MEQIRQEFIHNQDKNRKKYFSQLERESLRDIADMYQLNNKLSYREIVDFLINGESNFEEYWLYNDGKYHQHNINTDILYPETIDNIFNVFRIKKKYRFNIFIITDILNDGHTKPKYYRHYKKYKTKKMEEIISKESSTLIKTVYEFIIVTIILLIISFGFVTMILQKENYCDTFNECFKIFVTDQSYQLTLRIIFAPVITIIYTGGMLFVLNLFNLSFKKE